MAWKRSMLVIPLFLGLGLLMGPEWISPSETDDFFQQQVKPILNNKCISCHGGVKQSSGFSMMNRASFFRANESGKPAVDAENLAGSELLARINHPDPDERMPSGKIALSRKEKRILKRWIMQGAPWGQHWAYTPVKRVSVPEGPAWMAFSGKSRRENAEQAIDAFIREKLEEVRLKPNPPADKATLLRRVALDLTGLPAPERIARTFLESEAPDAYATLVDQLLASPRYGEKWASVWLDIARYADSKGYEKDGSRQIWRYRDWIIRALNADMPYDQFIREQLAGDLLPSPSDDQFIATAFHRNTPTNDEGGTDDEEFRTAAVIDRVNTTFEGLMSTTFACTQCHGHPYEDIRHEEYYQVLAFFNNSRDEDTVEDYPLLRHYGREDSIRLAQLGAWIARVASPVRAAAIVRFLKFLQPLIYATHADQFVNSELYDTKYLVFRRKSSARIREVSFQGETRLIAQIRGHQPGGHLAVHLDSAGGPLLGKFRIPSTEGRWEYKAFPIKAVYGKRDLFFSYKNAKLTNELESGLTLNAFHLDRGFPGLPGDALRAVHEETYWDLLRAQPPSTPVMMELPVKDARKTQVFERGNWKVKGKTVSPAIPNAFRGKFQLRQPDRAGLADWLTDKHNPLVSRTIANRLWEQVFGVGLVETLEDFGSQGATPSHPALLDHLAWELMHHHGWSLKALLRTIVLSETYRQGSWVYEKNNGIDPGNRLLSRFPRVRLSAEQVRDQALHVSGLLSSRMYGPSVMPSQPTGIWASPYDGNKWVTSKGEDRHRRALYTYYKRSSPYPSILSFDGAFRNVCTARRIRTNTPLQALVTLNDPVFMEAAVLLGQRMRHSGRRGIDAKLRFGSWLLLHKPLSPEKLQPLVTLHAKALSYYQSRPDLVCDLPLGGADAEDAAFALVANAMLNLDEVITKN